MITDTSPDSDLYRHTPVQASGGSGAMFSVDLEDWFHVNAFERHIARADWDRLPSRVERPTMRLLDMLARHNGRATFFVLGWVARKHPGLIREIVAAGHEIACHSHWHRRVVTLTPEVFAADLAEAEAAIEDAAQVRVVGFRAPSFSILNSSEWALDVLIERGYRYDSSRFPIRRPGYGSPHVPTEPHIVHRPGGTILEIPMTVRHVLGMRVPIAGGGYLRQFPFGVINGGFAERAAKGLCSMFYVHPWELDPEQPKQPVGVITTWRHYRGLTRTEALLNRLLGEYEFRAVRDRFPDFALPETNDQRSQSE